MNQASRDGLRLSIVIFVASLVGYGLFTPYMPEEIAQNIIGGCKWAALTSNALNASVLAKVAKQGTERIAGTVVGGILGHLLFVVVSLYLHFTFGGHATDGILLAIAAAIAAFSSVTLGSKYKLTYATKLANTTFLLVTFGSVSVGVEGSRMLAISRVIGISAGVVLMEVGSVLIFPKSATESSLEEMAVALRKLTEMNRVAWGHGPLYQPEWQAAWKKLAATAGNDGYERLPAADDYWSMDPDERERKYEEECESVLGDIYAQLQKVADLLPLLKSEIFIGVWFGKMIFLPGNPWYPVGWRLPEKDMKDLAMHLRRIARSLYTLHLSFTEGFDEHMVEMLNQNYPKRLIPALAETCQQALNTASDVFPCAATVDRTDMENFAAVGEGLLRISDYQRRRVLQHMKHTRTLHKRRAAERAASKWQAASTSSRHGEQAMGSMISRKEPYVRAPSFEGNGHPQPQPVADVERGMSTVAESVESGRERGAGDLLFDMEDDLAAPLLGRSPEGAALADKEKAGPGISRFQENAGPGVLTTQLDGNVGAGRSDPINMQQSETNVEVKPAFGNMYGTTFVGSPSEALSGLPTSVHIKLATPMDLDRTSSFVRESSGSLSLRVPVVQPEELIHFPETAEGYVAKVRWYSFQFLVEELALELEAMYKVLEILLPKLPHPFNLDLQKGASQEKLPEGIAA